MPERMIRPIAYSRAAARDALSDYLLLRSGIHPAEADPIAERLASDGRSLLDIAAHLAGYPAGTPAGPEVYRALNGSDFGVALTSAAMVSYTAQSAEHSAIVRDIEIRDLRPVHFPTLDLGELQVIPKAGGPIQTPVIVPGAGATGEAALFSGTFTVSRRLLIDDEAGLVVNAVQQLVGHAARLEAASIAAVIAANAAINGTALITAENTTAGGPTDTGVGAALALLRTRSTPAGSTANIRGAYLLVHPSDEVLALQTVAAITPPGSTPRLNVVVNPWLADDGASYLLADPAAVPTFARLLLSVPPRPSVENRRAPPTIDGTAYRVSHVFGLAAVGRQGIVKITT